LGDKNKVPNPDEIMSKEGWRWYFSVLLWKKGNLGQKNLKKKGENHSQKKKD